MKSKKQNLDSKNSSIGKVKKDECDQMISAFLSDHKTVESFIEASKKDGISESEIKKQLKHFGVKDK